MANHGYLPRSGKGITFVQIARALVECYGLYTFFAYFLSFGGSFLLRQWGPICLADIARHGAVEHDASLAHKNTPPGGVYAPSEIDEGMLEESIGWMTEEGDGLVDSHDVARARVNREKYSQPLDGVHAEIARGEMGIALLMFAPEGSPPGAVPAEYLREWIGSERLPLGGTWRPTRKVGLFATMKVSKQMKNTMGDLRKTEGGESAPGVLYVQPPPKTPKLMSPTETAKINGVATASYGTVKPANGPHAQASHGSRSTSSASAGVHHEEQDDGEEAKLLHK